MRRPLIWIAVASAATWLALLLVAGSAAALSTGNGGWSWQNPLPQGSPYVDGWFLNATHGWLISGGDIFRTTNGGLTLTVQARHTVDFTDITFVDATHGWAVGYPAGGRGTAILYRTTDGGKRWTRVRLRLVGGLDAVSFSTRKVGWAVSGSVAAHTLDGGLHWSLHRVPRVDWLVNVQALGVRHAWVCDDVDAVLRTDNGGRTWKRFVVHHPALLADLHFANLRDGWVAGDQGLSYTSDGGAHWTVQLSNKQGAGQMAFTDSQHGWALAGGGVYRTTDGGTTWTAQTTTPSSGWSFVAAPATSSAVIGGGGSGDQLSHSSDGGLSWSPVIAAAGDFSGELDALQFIDSHTGWSVGQSGEILNTSDGGTQWTPQTSGTDQDLHGVSFVDADHGWAVGGSNDWLNGTSSAVVVHSSDGGATWTPQAAGVDGLPYDLAGVAFVNAKQGWAVGGRDWGDVSGGVVLHTTDGGLSWVRQRFPGGDVALNAVAFADARHGWAVGEVVGDAGTNVTVILGTHDGGTTWTRQRTYGPPTDGNSSDAALTSVSCTDARHAVAVGSGNGYTEIFRTVNGGADWTRLTEPAAWDLELRDVVFADATHGWAVSQDTIIATTDGGAKWVRQYVGPTGGLTALSFVSRTRGWVAGRGADILTTTTGGFAP
jgi:photosystem II stability/assembly factor-like uncharacterized protein